MNIAFVTENEISPMLGGTERITATLSSDLMNRGFKCYSMYCFPLRSGFTGCDFCDSSLVPSEVKIEWIEDYLTKWSISIIVVNLVTYSKKKELLPLLRRASDKLSIKLISCYHAMPGEDFMDVGIVNPLYRLFHGYAVKQALKDIVLHVLPKPLFSLFFGRRIEKKYRLMPENSDCFVLLSEHFYEPYNRIAKLVSSDKYRAIGNSLSFPDVDTESLLKNKEKRVLVIARMEERSKRISAILRSWAIVEKSSASDSWSLDIVGGGPDLEWYKKMKDRLGLKRCTFWGRQERIELFYERASIFLMTSNYEGFGITLIEAQQYGVVPVVMNSYESLQDIVDNGKNGLIVPSGNECSFAEAVISLMKDDSFLTSMAGCAMVSCKQFAQNRIVDKWVDLFNEMLH